MPRARKKMNGNGQNGVPIQPMSKKMMKRKKPIDKSYMTPIEPITDNQKLAFEAYANGKNLLLHGAAGTGKTFISLYLALQEVLDESTQYDKIVIVRSLVPTREIGFLPGDHEDKSYLYQIPYKNCLLYTSPSPRDRG